MRNFPSPVRDGTRWRAWTERAERAIERSPARKRGVSEPHGTEPASAGDRMVLYSSGVRLVAHFSRWTFISMVPHVCPVLADVGVSRYRNRNFLSNNDFPG